MKLGLCTIAAGNQPIETVASIAADAGYAGIEIWGRGHIGDGSEAACRSVREAARDNDLEIPVYGSYLRPGTDGFDAIDEELEIADRLGASLIRVWAGHEEFQDRSDEHWRRTIDDLQTLSDRTAENGIGVTVEKHEGTLTNTQDGARRLIEAVDRPNCGLNWQPLFGLSPDEVLAEARELAPLSNNVHVQAIPESGRPPDERCLLEDAFFDVPAVVDAFEEAGLDGYVEVEFVTDDLAFEEAAERDREYLESILAGRTE
ncbi:sugar phosphate isomerase/epimerase family protein [Natrialbaceae archaeon A-CW1-1]